MTLAKIVVFSILVTLVALVVIVATKPPVCAKDSDCNNNEVCDNNKCREFHTFCPSLKSQSDTRNECTDSQVCYNDKCHDYTDFCPQLNSDDDQMNLCSENQTCLFKNSKYKCVDNTEIQKCDGDVCDSAVQCDPVTGKCCEETNKCGNHCCSSKQNCINNKCCDKPCGDDICCSSDATCMSDHLTEEPVVKKYKKYKAITAESPCCDSVCGNKCCADGYSCFNGDCMRACEYQPPPDTSGNGNIYDNKLYCTKSNTECVNDGGHSYCKDTSKFCNFKTPPTWDPVMEADGVMLCKNKKKQTDLNNILAWKNPNNGADYEVEYSLLYADDIEQSDCTKNICLQKAYFPGTVEETIDVTLDASGCHSTIDCSKIPSFADPSLSEAKIACDMLDKDTDTIIKKVRDGEKCELCTSTDKCKFLRDGTYCQFGSRDGKTCNVDKNVKYCYDHSQQSNSLPNAMCHYNDKGVPIYKFDCNYIPGNGQIEPLKVEGDWDESGNKCECKGGQSILFKHNEQYKNCSLFDETRINTSSVFASKLLGWYFIIWLPKLDKVMTYNFTDTSKPTIKWADYNTNITERNDTQLFSFTYHKNEMYVNCHPKSGAVEKACLQPQCGDVGDRNTVVLGPTNAYQYPLFRLEVVDDGFIIKHSVKTQDPDIHTCNNDIFILNTTDSDGNIQTLQDSTEISSIPKNTAKLQLQMICSPNYGIPGYIPESCEWCTSDRSCDTIDCTGGLCN